MRSYTRSGHMFRSLAAAGLIALVASACSSSDDASGEGPRIVVTTGVWGDVVSNVVGDDAVVEVVIPVGADPHDYSPSSQQVASMQEADLVVANGLGLEEGLEELDMAIAGRPGLVPALAQRGVILYLLGRKEEAREAWEKALYRDPLNKLIQLYLNALDREA